MTLSEKYENGEQITKREIQEQTSCSGGPGYERTLTRRPAIVRFLATSRQMPGQRLKFGNCLFVLRPFYLAIG